MAPAFPVLAAVALALLTPALLYLLLANRGGGNKRGRSSVPPGDLGWPVVGHTFALLRAFRETTDDEWFRARIRRHGPVSKMSVFGSPTVLMAGPAANHFIFSNEGLVFTQTRSANALVGRSILSLTGEELRQVRAAVQAFLKPEMVRRFVCKMDQEVRRHIDIDWNGHDTVTVMPWAKRLAFSMIWHMIIGHDTDPSIRDGLAADCEVLVKALLSIPLRIPFTRFSKGMAASARIRKVLTEIARGKEEAILQGKHSVSATNDFITYMLALRSEGAHSLSLEDIVDNAIGLTVAGYETSAVVITFMIRHLANEPDVFAKLCEEQDEIARSKGPDEALTWDDVGKMKYTWRVAMETMRTIPPLFGSFRTATKDIEYQGYLIPKGWQVFTAQTVTHLDGDLFHEPSKFDPSRFENQSAIPPYSFVPFGGGSRMCPGNQVAKTEALVTMHYLVRQFRWKMSCKEEGYEKDPTPIPVLGLPIDLETRI